MLLFAVGLLVLALQDDRDFVPLFERLVSVDPEVRATARGDFLKLASEKRDALKQAAASSPAAQVALAFLGEAAVQKDVARLLAGDASPTSRAAAEAIGNLGADAAAKELLKLLESDDLPLAMAAARSLSRAKAAPHVKALQAIADKPEMPRRKVLAVYALELAQPADRLPMVLAQAESAVPAVREAAWAVLANLPRAAELVRRRPEGNEREVAPGLKRIFEAQPMPEDLRGLAGKFLVRAGAYAYADVVELVTHPSKEVSGWARKAVLDPALYRRSVLVALVLRKLGERENEVDATKDPIPALEEILQGQGAKAEGPKLKERLESYRAWWEKNRVPGVDKDVFKAIDDGVAWLRSKQLPDGSWKYCTCGVHPNDHHTPGSTALAVYTLLKCDVLLKDRAVAQGLDFLLTVPLEKTEGGLTYTFALEAMAFAEAIQILQVQLKAEREKKAKADKALLAETLAAIERYAKRLRECAEWLVEAQTRITRGGQEMGDWGYAKPANNDMDNSNTQFAVLGLRAAQNAGFPVPERTWAKALSHWLHDQTKDGGWPYRKDKDPNQGGTASMSAAGMYSALVAAATLRRKDPAALTGDPPIRKALEYFKKQYPIPEPRRDRAGGHVHSPYYDLYSLERAMMVSKTERIDGKDWYHEGALYILANQAWGGDWIDTTDTCFALLFLKKAYVAVATGESR